MQFGVIFLKIIFCHKLELSVDLVYTLMTDDRLPSQETASSVYSHSDPMEESRTG